MAPLRRKLSKLRQEFDKGHRNDMALLPKRFDDDRSEASSLHDRLSSAQIDAGNDAEKIVIGIDFGTTYSGVAYAFTVKPTELQVVKEWPGSKGITYEKCPTLLKYEENGTLKCGFELDRAAEGRIEAIKLLLDPGQPKPLYVPQMDTLAELDKLGKSASAVATDYISWAFKHAVTNIESKYPKGYFETLRKQYVLTVPAVWSEKAQDLTQRAARNAGITPVKLVKEPEAAALYTLNEMGDKGLQVGDAFVICDAGGGTVDLISYEIVSLRPFELKELVASKGSLAGSLMLNRRFEEYIRNVVGEKEFARIRETSAYARAMKHFDEVIKVGLHSSDDNEYYVNFPKAGLKDRPEKGLAKDTITVKKSALEEVFEPIIAEIDRLVSEQITEARLKRVLEGHPKGQDIKAIFLVGGFGASSYLHSRIHARHHPAIQVIQPNNAWSAIVRGAVMFGLSSEVSGATVVSSVAGKHYGVEANVYDIDPVEDAGRKQIYNQWRGVWGVSRMFWYIHQGDDLMRARPIEFDFFRSFGASPSKEDLVAEDSLVECTDIKAPRHPNTRMKKACTVKVDLSVVPRDHFVERSRYENSGNITKWLELSYKLIVTIQSGPMKFSFKCHGKEYAAVEAQY